MEHTHHLLCALALAQVGQGRCAPNPAVGAVVVHEGRVIAEAAHQGAGSAHAEVAALETLRAAQARGATVYVTLEPCCHHGKTPPCTDYLIARGVGAVVYGLRDPNYQVAGQGAAQLRAAGIACTQHPLPEIQDFYASYTYWQRTQRPRVTAKLALSIDGKIAAPGGGPTPITGPELQHYTHTLRDRSDALLTTARTVIADDPQYNVRLPDQPIRTKKLYVLDSGLSLPVQARVVTTTAALTLFYRAEGMAPELHALQERVLLWEKQGVRCIALPSDPTQGLLTVLQQIGADGIHDLWVEAGARCFASLVGARLLHRALLYVSPKVLGAEAISGFEGMMDLRAHATQVCWRPYGSEVVCDIRWEQG